MKHPHRPGAMRHYIGDGVYLTIDGPIVELATEDGVSVTNHIVLEPEVYAALIATVERARATP